MNLITPIVYEHIPDTRLKDSIEQMTRIVTAYAENGASCENILHAIPRVHAAIMGLSSPPQPILAKQEPAVPVKKSITHDYIICLEDGSKHRSMKRYLANKFGMTPEEYRDKWDLPKDYPLVSPEYSARRSQLAKDSGLGKKK